MATLNFPDEPTTGDIYNDSNSGFSYEWNGTVWISTDPQRAANIREIDDISSDFNGSTTAFTLKVAGVNVEPANAQQLIVSVGGVMQNAGDDFTVSGATLTFTTAPDSGLTFFGTILGQSLSLNTVADGSVGSASLKTEDFTIGGSGNTVTIPGNLTVQGTETIINTERLDIQDKTVGIASTNAPTSTSQDGAGAIIYGQTHVNILYDVDKAALGINTGVSVAGFVTATGLRSLGVTTCGAGLSLADSVKAKFGDSGDLEIYHDGSNSYIKDAGTGILQLNTNYLQVKNAADDETILAASQNGPVSLYYDNVKRWETASDDKGGGVIVTGKIVGTAATIGSGVTINNTGIDAGIGAGIITAKTYYGDATNMTGAGSTFQVLTTSPYQGEELTNGTPLAQNIIIGFNHAISAGNADKNITLRTGSASGDVVETFDVDSDVTYSFGQAILNPSADLELENTYFVVADEGAVMKVGTATSSPIINTYSFTTADAFHKLFTWGMNQHGVLGQNKAYAQIEGRSSPTQVGTDETWGPRASQSTGNSSEYMSNIKTDGTLWMWGTAINGALGLNDTQRRSSPTQVGTNTNWSNIIAGNEGAHLAVKTDGTLWAWGGNKQGVLAQNNEGDGLNVKSSPTQIGTGTDWSTHFATGSTCFAAIKTDGTLWTWGNGYQGQLGQNQGGASTQYSSPVQIPGTTWSTLSRGGDGTNNFLATKTDGTLWAWGRGDYGIMGLNNNTYYSSPTQVGTNTNWAIVAHQQADENNVALATKTDGTLWSWGSGGAGQPSQSGARGLNNSGLGALSSPMQVGTDTTWPKNKNQPYRLSAGKLQAGAIKTTGSLWVWGKNHGGQLGNNSLAVSRSSPTQIGSGNDWDSIYIHGANTSSFQTAQATTKAATPG